MSTTVCVRPDHARQHDCHLIVRQVTAGASDAVLERPGIRTSAKHVDVVIGLEHQDVRVLQSPHVVTRLTHIRDQCQMAIAVRDAERDRGVAIVGDADGANGRTRVRPDAPRVRPGHGPGASVFRRARERPVLAYPQRSGGSRDAARDDPALRE